MTLSNRLTFILSVCSLLGGCAQKGKEQTVSEALNRDCKETNVLIREKHLVLSAKEQKKNNLIACFKNYLKFEDNKEQEVFTCNQINIRRSGNVSFVATISRGESEVPKDMKWCMEQEFWKMDFGALQLDRSYQIVFPLNFSSLPQ